MSDLHVTIDSSSPSVVEIKLPDVARVFSVKEQSQGITILDKYSIVGVGASADKSFVFTQGTPQSTWTIPHGLNKFPSVSIIDSANRLVFGEIEYIDENSVRIYFNGGFSGKAFLN